MQSTRSAGTEVWGYVLFTAVVFGSGGLIAKSLVDDGWDPLTLSWLPFMIGGTFGLAVGISKGHLKRSALKAGVILGIGAGAIPGVLFNVGFDRLSAGLVTLLIALGPVVTAIVAHFVFDDERFNTTKGLGLVLAVIGVSILAAGSLGGDGDAAAIALVIVGSAAAGASGVLSRLYATRHGSLSLIAPQLLVASGAALVLSLLLQRPFMPDGGLETWHVLLIIPFGLSGFFGFLSMLKANELGTTGQVSVIGYCIPVFGVIGGALLFDEDITTSVIVGGLLIVVSMGVIARGSQSRTDPTRPDLPAS